MKRRMQSQSQHSQSQYSAVSLQEAALELDEAAQRGGDHDRLLPLKHGSEHALDRPDSLLASFWPAGIASLTIQINDSKKSTASPPRAAAPPRWTSREFYAYYAIVMIALYKVIQAPLRLSRGVCSTLFVSIA